MIGEISVYVFRKANKRIVSERVFDRATLDKRLAHGWSTSRDGVAPKPEADSVAPVPVADPEPPPADVTDDAPLTRAELEAKAAELGLKVDGRWSDRRLMAELTKVLEG